MKRIEIFRYNRFVLAFISILIIFLAIVITFIITQHGEMMKEVESDAQHEIELIGTFTREALLMNDYAAVEQFLVQWAREHEEIIEIRAIAPNNFVLAHYERTVTPEKIIRLSHVVSFENRELIRLEMIKDLSPAQKSMLKFTIPLLIGYSFLTLMLGILLWLVMKKLALLPMEKEIMIREQAERKFRLLLESAPDALILTDSTGHIFMINAQAELLFGYNRNEVIGKELEMLMPERFRDKHHAMRDKFVLKPASRPMGLDMELFGITKKGKEFPADISLSPIETEEGLFILSAVRDITERKLTEVKIKRSYVFQRAISNILSKSMESTSLQQQLEHILDTILAIPGLSLESMGCIYLSEDNFQTLSMTAQRGLPDSIQSKCSKVPFDHCLCGQAASNRKIIFAPCTDSRHSLHHNNGAMPHSHYCVPIIHANKTLGLINLVVKKGHERNKDEEDLLTSIANTIAGIIMHSRTDQERQRLQEQLADAEKLSALGRFTANIAHDIRTPLTLIGGFARRLLKYFSGNVKEKEYLHIIISEVNRLENILSNILAYSSSTVLNRKAHDLNSIIQDSLVAYQEKCSQSYIDIKAQFNTIPFVNIDRDQVIEVINNLLSNAIDSMPQGGTLTVSTETNSFQNKDYIVMNLSDTGEGISQDHIKMIFEPFYSTKIFGHGTGLGLPISKKIIENHGGFITVESEIGKGSTFKLFFPRNGRQ